MDAGCSRHGCWYAQQGYDDCYDSGDGRCILAFAVSAPPQPEGTDLSGCATIASGAITARQLEAGPLTAGEFAGFFDDGRGGLGSPWQPWHSPAPLYTLHPGSVVSGRQFDLAFLPVPGRGIMYREHEHSPADAPHPAQEHPDPEEGDVWYVPGPEGASWLFYCGAWREVLGLQVDITWERTVDIRSGLTLPSYDGRSVQMRGTWK